MLESLLLEALCERWFDLGERFHVFVFYGVVLYNVTSSPDKASMMIVTLLGHLRRVLLDEKT